MVISAVMAAQTAISELDDRPIPVEAMAEATEKFEQYTEQVAELIRATLDQGGDLRDLDGHPLLSETIDSGEKYKQATEEAREATQKNFERLSAIVGEASAMVAVLERNKGARELSRERFTDAARQALGTPLPEQQPSGAVSIDGRRH